MNTLCLDCFDYQKVKEKIGLVCTNKKCVEKYFGNNTKYKWFTPCRSFCEFKRLKKFKALKVTAEELSEL